MSKHLAQDASRSIRLLSFDERQRVDPALLSFIEHRKSGLSLNHIIGCPLNCHYCVRLLWDNFDMKTPAMLATDEEALTAITEHPHFVPGRTPIQIFNRATEPFLPSVRPHLFYILKALDDLMLENLVIVITRYIVTADDMIFLESLKHIRLAVFFTYSGGVNRQVEAIDPSITRKSILTAGQLRQRIKLILYWRPLVIGWNDDEATMSAVLELGRIVDAIVFSGLFYREKIAANFEKERIRQPYAKVERRKILPQNLEHKVLSLHTKLCVRTPIFRKTTCAAAYVHGMPDPNGHWGIREICDICPTNQQSLCEAAHQAPSNEQIKSLFDRYGYKANFELADGHIWTEGLSEQQRYNLQHILGYQVWDRRYAHLPHQHGRARTGWPDDDD